MSKGWHHMPVVTNLFGPMSPLLALKLFATPTSTFVHLLPYKCFFFIRSTSACDLNFRLNSSSTRACVEIRELSRIFPFRRWLPVIPHLYFTCHSPCAISPSPLGANGSPQPGCSNLFCHPELFKGVLSKCKKNIRGNNVAYSMTISHTSMTTREDE